MWFTYQGSTPIEAIVCGWSDTIISCDVPAGVVDNYPASAGSGPVVVQTAEGAKSLGFNFSVPFGYAWASWKSPSVSYRVNANCPALGAQATPMIDAAAASWTAVGTPLTLQDAGSSSAVDIVKDGSSTISWAQMEQGVLAHAGSFYTDDYLWVTECDLSFNTYYKWGMGSADTIDVQTTCLHEMGHWLRLLDLYGPSDSPKTMYGFGKTGEVKRTLDAGDIEGIQWIYPQSAARVTQIDPWLQSAGKSLTIVGRNFGTSGAVKIAGQTAAVSSWTPNQISCTIPSAVAPGIYRLTVEPSGQAAANEWTVFVQAAEADDGDIPKAQDLPASPVENSLDENSDPDDVFKVPMQAGQVFKVWLYAGADTDYDLYLYDHTATTVNQTNLILTDSAYEGSFEEFIFQAEDAGTYYLRVNAYSGSGDYLLGWGYPDKLATLTFSASPSTVAYGGIAKLSGKVTDLGGAPFADYQLVVQSKPVGSSTWKTLGTPTTSATGAFSMTNKPTIKTSYRYFFYGTLEYLPSFSTAKTVTPRAYVGNPAAPTYGRRNVAFTTYGYLKPRHTAGSYAVRIYKYRLVSGRWRAYGYVNAKASNYSSYSKYSAAVRLPYAGRWRLRAYHADSGHATSWSSGYDYVTVR